MSACKRLLTKFWLSDRQVLFDPAKYGWPWVAGTVSWVVPTSMALITLERAKKRGLIRGSELEKRLRLGAEMLLDRACPGGGWNADNAVVYGIPLRPHIDATALALAALRFHCDLPIVRSSLTWILHHIDCPSAYSLPMYSRMAPSNSLTLRKTPRRMRLFVSSANQRSTRLIQEP